jgi:hypothetical protein
MNNDKTWAMTINIIEIGKGRYVSVKLWRWLGNGGDAPRTIYAMVTMMQTMA